MSGLKVLHSGPSVFEGRDFTDPRWTIADRSTLGYLTDALADRADDPARRDGWMRWVDSDAAYRWLVPSWEGMAATSKAEQPAVQATHEDRVPARTRIETRGARGQPSIAGIVRRRRG
jgi:hypothetical protein